MTKEDFERSCELLRGHGFSILDERDQAINCLHARCLACPDEIMRD